MSTNDDEAQHEIWRRICLEQPRAFEDFPFGPEAAVFKVGATPERSKMFAFLSWHRGELILNLKCEPPIADRLRTQYPQITPGYHMNKKHWNTVRVGLPEQFMRELIEDSYDLVVAGLSRRDQEFIKIQGIVQDSSLD
ncbi:MmcQ/YjbR family DNA-binding protein [Glutamicibacter sp. PS]|uniref:MmcQ/YjbR family DNA-binding protein n=1 Tax=Glutamicibacter sp. PS TaxID=3075634 RepID=UPI00283C5EE6|nr:MmcQ/YjbR family DNA-binding protein [Glutamicibacter sp. PS]MDR4534028.1 MmcQ/YjbR family DNA-binding protein [Glutamicibacter sp. PS]